MSLSQQKVISPLYLRKETDIRETEARIFISVGVSLDKVKSLQLPALDS